MEGVLKNSAHYIFKISEFRHHKIPCRLADTDSAVRRQSLGDRLEFNMPLSCS